MNGLINLIKTHWIVLSCGILISITTLSLWPADQLPQVPGTDKTHHLLAYALLMLPAALRRPKHWLLIALFFIGFSGVIELIQPYVNRYGEWLDMLANSAGVALGVVTGMLMERLWPGNRG